MHLVKYYTEAWSNSRFFRVAGAIEDDGSLTLVGMASDHATIHRVPLGVAIVCSRCH